MNKKQELVRFIELADDDQLRRFAQELEIADSRFEMREFIQTIKGILQKYEK